MKNGSRNGTRSPAEWVPSAFYLPGLGYTHHTHLVCMECGRVEEFQSDAIQEFSEGAAKDVEFQASFTCLELYGRCARCRENDEVAAGSRR